MRLLIAFLLLAAGLYGAYVTFYLALKDSRLWAQTGLVAAFFIVILVTASVVLGLAESFGFVSFE